jgi:hypothetical protein
MVRGSARSAAALCSWMGGSRPGWAVLQLCGHSSITPASSSASDMFARCSCIVSCVLLYRLTGMFDRHPSCCAGTNNPQLVAAWLRLLSGVCAQVHGGR